ncbi:hypothetical protein HMPREF0813_00047 [Streptococcus anginosus F0211]|uniref:Uncharacterized protein n=1 Tax=Streptococcus anginosus F0211 TaxID=706437 RepID=E6IYI5_STRAP|nr:hypothetical protein HMPREF0813_00047 [Streptococcus anginosus F0211]
MGSVPLYPKTEVGLSTPEFICYKSATSKIEQALNYNPQSFLPRCDKGGFRIFLKHSCLIVTMGESKDDFFFVFDLVSRLA